MSYTPFVEELIKLVVDKPEAVEIDEEVEGTTRTFFIRVDADDVGKVIGKNGRVISAMRAVVSAVAAKQREKAYVKIVTE
jgi:predicted RNA-binding protein YlqC (UPF0109 family)